MDQPTQEQIRAAYEDRGYVLFPGAYNMNLWGVRSADSLPNTFNDWVGFVCQSGSIWCAYAFPATTDPGTYWRLNPVNVRGTAIMAPGQYKGAYKIGLHKGYKALQQKGPVTVWRDADRDNRLDTDGRQETGVFGLNIHRASPAGVSGRVDRWSAGCQVLADSAHFAFLMDMCGRSRQKYGNSFTYTLFDEKDFT